MGPHRQAPPPPRPGHYSQSSTFRHGPSSWFSRCRPSLPPTPAFGAARNAPPLRPGTLATPASSPRPPRAVHLAPSSHLQCHPGSLHTHLLRGVPTLRHPYHTRAFVRPASPSSPNVFPNKRPEAAALASIAGALRTPACSRRGDARVAPAAPPRAHLLASGRRSSQPPRSIPAPSGRIRGCDRRLLSEHRRLCHFVPRGSRSPSPTTEPRRHPRRVDSGRCATPGLT